ncbi:MAG: MFS transporter [Polyangiaceae bacterium]|nr:MFS transporter [Polyangiaceae bacterium]
MADTPPVNEPPGPDGSASTTPAGTAASPPPLEGRAVQLAVLVAALGYFVDIYDLILFGVVRVDSLKELQVADDGLWILRWQMIGMLIGGILWGILGDKRGRLSVLFGSILLYSIANIANGFVQDITTYGYLRFIAGVGLAGELGAGITLVSESMSKERRGYGTMIVASVGICGAIAAWFVGTFAHWRTAYFVGGGMGIALLLLRIGVYESGMFQQVKKREVSRGNFFKLFWPPGRLRRYLAVILVGVPIWYVIGLPISFADKFGKAMQMTDVPKPKDALLFAYIGLALGDFSSGALSQIIRSRKKALLVYVLLTGLFLVAYFTVGASSKTAFYTTCALLGFATGYWAVFVTVASEQFGTNLRATATTTVPNFVRGAVAPMTLAFESLTPKMGVLNSAQLVGLVTFVLAVGSIVLLDETHGKDLDFLED